MRRIVCGDDTMGTLLLDRGVPVDHCLEELCITEPNRIRLFTTNTSRPARVIETNTFGANAVRLKRFGFEDRVAKINNGGGAGRAQGRARRRRLCCRKCRAAANRRS